MITQNQLDAVRRNILDAPASIVASQREELLEVLAAVQARADVAGRIDGVRWDVVDALRQGVRNAPPGVVVYHEKLHLLMVFDALDLMQDALDARTAPPAVAEAAVDPAELFEDPTATE